MSSADNVLRCRTAQIGLRCTNSVHLTGAAQVRLSSPDNVHTGGTTEQLLTRVKILAYEVLAQVLTLLLTQLVGSTFGAKALHTGLSFAHRRCPGTLVGYDISIRLLL